MNVLDMSIKKKVSLIGSAVLLLLLFSAYVHHSALEQIESAWHNYRNEAVQRQKLIKEIYAQFGYGGFIHNFKNYILRGEQIYADRFEQNRIRMFGSIEALKKLVRNEDAEEQRAVGNIEKTALQYAEKIKTAGEMIKENKSPTEIDQVVKIDDTPAFEAFALIQQRFEDMERDSIRALDDAKKQLFFLYIGAFISACLVLTSVFLIFRSIWKRLENIRIFIRKMGKGDFSSITADAGTAVSGNDEIGDMARTLDRAVNNLNEMIGKTISTARDMSGLTLQLASSIEETSSSLEEMSSMTKRTAENAGQVKKFIKDTDSAMNAASNSVTQLIHSMEEISRVADETSVIVKTIDEIAFQTNLLALNAAVEAARAGETGAGFAVVAGEVRSLAMRSAEAAKNTSERIAGTVSKIQKVSQHAKTTGETFNTVKGYAGKISELLTQISDASDEQAQGIEQINRAMLEIDVITQRNAVYAENLSQSVRHFNVKKNQ